MRAKAQRVQHRGHVGNVAAQDEADGDPLEVGERSGDAGHHQPRTAAAEAVLDDRPEAQRSREQLGAPGVKPGDGAPADQIQQVPGGRASRGRRQAPSRGAATPPGARSRSRPPAPRKRRCRPGCPPGASGASPRSARGRSRRRSSRSRTRRRTATGPTRRPAPPSPARPPGPGRPRREQRSAARERGRSPDRHHTGAALRCEERGGNRHSPADGAMAGSHQSKRRPSRTVIGSACQRARETYDSGGESTSSSSRPSSSAMPARPATSTATARSATRRRESAPASR